MIQASQIHFNVGSKQILNGIDLEINKGEVLSILGPNGAGKTSLLKCLTGAQAPTSGSITLEGINLCDYPSRTLAQYRAVLSQSTNVSFPFTADEIVLMGRNPHILGSESKRDIEIVEEILDSLHALHLKDRLFSTLSGGEQQRIQFARVLAQIWDQEDAYLFLDEPTAALDVKHQIGILEIARDLAKSRGFAVCTILHDLKMAKIFSDKILFLKHGEILVTYNQSEDFRMEDICQLMEVSEEYVSLLLN